MTNQANIFRATMANYEEVLKATEIAENANGSATERMALYTESLTAKINSLKTAWTQFVNNLDLDGKLASLIELATRFIELLDILLNKIPILSSALKALITVQSVNILAGATVKAISKIAGPQGIAGLLSGLVDFKKVITTILSDFSGFASLVSNEVYTALSNGTSAFKAFTSAIATLGITSKMALGIFGALIAAISAGYYIWDKYFSIDSKIEEANNKLQESEQSLSDTKDKIEEIQLEINEINKTPEAQLTESEKNRLSILQEQLDVYEKIRDVKQKTVDEDTRNANELEAKKKSESYSGMGGYFRADNEYRAAISHTRVGNGLWGYDDATFAQYLVQLQTLYKIQSDINNGTDKYGSTLQDVESQIQIVTSGLEDQVAQLYDDKLWFEEVGLTGEDAYKDIVKQLEIYNALMNPSDWEQNTIENLVDFDSIVQDITNGGEQAANAIKQTAENVASKIQEDQSLKAAAEAAFGIDLETTEGYQKLVDILINDIPIAYQRAQEAADSTTSGMTSEQVALREAFETTSGALKQYASDVQEISSKQEILNTAFSEMKDSGHITVETMKSLIEQEPELASAIEITNGVITIQTDALQDLSDKYYDAKIAEYQFQIDSLDSAVDGASKRIEAYSTEMSVLDDLIEKMATANKENWTASDWAQYKGMVKTRDQLQQDYETIEQQNRYMKAIEALQALKQGGLSYTGSSSKSGENDPEKEAYELKKSEIELIQKQIELEKSKLEQQKDNIQQQKSVLELQKSELELQKQEKEQQLEIIQDSEEGIDDIIELIKKMNEQEYENLKTNLQNVKDYISDFRDALDAVKDSYDNIIDATKEKLDAEKESLDNQRKLQDSAKSIAEIQAELMEIQYDDSSDAQARRLELTAQLNEKQQEMQEELQDQAYDAAIDSLDASRDKVDSIFESIGQILEISESAIEDYIDYISDELQSESNLYLQAVSQFNDTSEGAREELYNRLIEWNQRYGDNVTATVTEPWNQAIEAVERYQEIVGSTDIDAIRQYLGNQDMSLSESIKIDEQAIDGLTSQIDEIQISMDKVDIQINQFEQAISRVKDALSQLEIDYNTKSISESEPVLGVSGSGSEYAYNLIKQLLLEAGIETDSLPSTYQQFIDGLKSITESSETTSDAVEDFGNQIETSGDIVSESGDKAESAGNKVEQTEQPLTDLAEQGERAAGALGVVANEANSTSNGNSVQGIFDLLTGGDIGKFIEQFATKAISKYLPKLLSSGVNMIGRLHDGTSQVNKSDSWLDKMLGLGQDETARILKVGEAVIPDYANNINNINNQRDIFPKVSIPNTSNVKTTNNSSLNIDMGDLDINGIDTTELRNELENIKNESANRVYQTLNRYIRVGGYRNVKNRYN